MVPLSTWNHSSLLIRWITVNHSFRISFRKKWFLFFRKFFLFRIDSFLSLIHQLVAQLINESTNQSTDQFISRVMNQSIDQVISQWPVAINKYFDQFIIASFQMYVNPIRVRIMVNASITLPKMAPTSVSVSHRLLASTAKMVRQSYHLVVDFRFIVSQPYLSYLIFLSM